MKERGYQTDSPEKNRIFFKGSNFKTLNFYEKKKKLLCLILAVLMHAVLCLNVEAASGLDVPQHPAIMGDVGGVIMDNEHLDTEAMITRLKAANVKTYFYLLSSYDAATAWYDFCNDFMPAAQEAGIDVYVYLMPPSLNGPEAPYDDEETGYNDWAYAIAVQATYYSRLKGIVIDDLTLNLVPYYPGAVAFTPEVIDTMMGYAHAICPRLSFLAVCYVLPLEGTENYRSHDRFFFEYADSIDGIICPYMDMDDVSDLDDHIEDIKGQVENVVSYQSIALPASTEAAPGTYGRIAQTISVVPSQGYYEISFRHFGDTVRSEYSTDGYLRKRFLIDGQVVWYEDIANQPLQFGDVVLNVTPYLSGKSSVTIAFELFAYNQVYNYEAAIGFKNLSAINASVYDFSTTNWTFSTNSSFTGERKVFSPTNGTNTLSYTPLIYTRATSWHPADPTNAYITEALNVAGTAVKNGVADGLVTFNLPKTWGIEDAYIIVMAAFFNYRDLFYRVGAWMFDENSGSSVGDSSIFGYNGTASNTSWDNSDCISGSALSFNRASSSQVSVANDISMPLTGDLTLSLWIKPGNLSNRQNLLDKHYYGEFSLVLETNGTVSYYHGKAANNYHGQSVLSVGTVQTDEWQHIVVTRDAGTCTIKGYYNGSLSISGTYSSALQPDASTNPILIGYGYTGGFTGKIDQPVIYSRALDSGEVSRQYFDRYCKGSWGFNEDFSTTAFDDTLYANDGTASNTSWDNSDSVLGSALSFSRASSSQVSVANDASLQLTGDLTLSLWVKPGNLSNRQSLLDKRYWGEFSLTLETNGAVSYYHGQATDNYCGGNVFNSGTVTTGSWQHIVVTRNAATRTITGYYNGVQKLSWTYSSALPPTASTNPVLIGSGYAGGFTGKIDEVKIYNQALSTTNVTNLYDSY